MYSFPFEPRAVLENHLSLQTRQFIEQEVQRIFDNATQQEVQADRVANEAIDWVLDVYNAAPLEIASVPERFDSVLKKPNGIHILDYVLGAFQAILDEKSQPFRKLADRLAKEVQPFKEILKQLITEEEAFKELVKQTEAEERENDNIARPWEFKAQQLIDYFYPILQRYKIRIGAENLLAISERYRVPEGKLDLSERVGDVEQNYQQDLVNRKGAAEVHAFLEEYPDHPFTLPIKALVSQVDGYDFSSFAVSMLENLYDRCGQIDHAKIDNQKWYLEEVPEGIRLIFKAALFPEENKPVADHSLVYLLSKEADEFYGRLEQFTLTPHADETRRICVAGALFSDHLFPLEHPDSLFMNNFEDRLVLDDYFKQFFFASPQGQVGVIQEFEGEAKTSLHAVAVLAVLQGLQQNEVYPDLEIDPSKDWLKELLKYREGIHFLDYVLGEFYKKAFELPNAAKSKKMMNTFVHHFLPMMLERKIVCPHLEYVGYSADLRKAFLNPFYEIENVKLNDPNESQEVKEAVENGYLKDKDRGLFLLKAFLEYFPEQPLAIFLKALLAQGPFGVINGMSASSSSWFREKNMTQKGNQPFYSFKEISNGYRICIRLGCFNIVYPSDNDMVDESSKDPFFHSTLTFELTWNEEQEKAEVQNIGLGYTPYDNNLVNPVFARHQCFVDVSKPPEMLAAKTSMLKKSEMYRSYFQHFLFSEHPETISHRWIDYFQHYMHVSLAVRPVFLDVIAQGNLPSKEKETVFEKIFEQQIKAFFQENGMQFEHLRTFCSELTPQLRVMFYHQFKAYVVGNKETANQEEQAKREQWLADLEAKRPNGDALLELEKDFEFWETLKKFGQGESIAEDAISRQSPIVSFHAGEQFHLSDNARSWLFDENGNFRKPPEGRKGTHYVLPVCLDIPYDPDLDLDTYEGEVFEVVLWPDMSSFPRQRLGQQMFGEGLFPRASMGCLYYQGRQIPFDARKHVPGQLFSTSLQEQPEDLSRINSRSFTRNFLLTLLLLVSDVHGRNILLKSLEDGTFDVGIFDARAFLEQKDIKKPEIVNLLLLLDLMQKPEALDPEVINDFLKRDFSKGLDEWLKACQFENKRLSDLFEDVARFYVPNKDRYMKPGQPPLEPLIEHSRNSSLLAIPVGGFIEGLFSQAEQLQEELQEWTNESPLEILRHVLPLLHKFYKPCFEKGTVSERLEYLLGLIKKGLKPETYSSTSVSILSAHRATGLYPTQLSRNEIQAIAKEADDFFCPRSARRHLDELIAFVEQKDDPTLRSILGELLSDQPNTENFKKLYPRQKWLCLQRLYKHLDDTKISLTKKQQRAILDVLLETPFSTLSLRRYADVITDKDINRLVTNGKIYYLRTLKLDGTLLTARALQCLAKKRDLPLEHLSLRNMPNLREANRKLYLPNLKTLDLRNSSISSFPFDAPELRHLYLEGNFNLVKTDALFRFFNKRAQKKCVIHLNGNSQFVQKVFEQTNKFSDIEFDITDPALQSKVLNWLAQHWSLEYFIHRFPWLSSLEELTLFGSLALENCEKLFRLIQPVAVHLKRVVINAGRCDNSIVATLLHYFPDISQISLRRYEQTPIPLVWEELKPLAAVSKGEKLFCASEETLFLMDQNGERADLKDSQGLMGRIKKQENEERLPQHHSVYLVGELDLNRVMAIVQSDQDGEPVDELYVWDIDSGNKLKQTVLPHRINYLIGVFGNQFLTLHARENIGTRLWEIQPDGSVKECFFQSVRELNSGYVNYPYAYYWTDHKLVRVNLRTQKYQPVCKTPANEDIYSVIAFDQYVYVQTSDGTLQFDSVSLDQLNKLKDVDLSYNAVIPLSSSDVRLLRLKYKSMKKYCDITESSFDANFPKDISHAESTIFSSGQKKLVHYEEYKLTPFLISKRSERVFFIGERGRLNLSDPMPPISLDELRSDLRVVAVTSNYVAIRIENQKTRETLSLLDFRADQIKAFPNHLFFKKDQMQGLFGISLPGLLGAPLGFQGTHLKNVEEDAEFKSAILKVKEIGGVNYVYFPEVEGSGNAYYMLNELLRGHLGVRRIHLGAWRIHLEDVHFSWGSDFYENSLQTYSKSKFHPQIRICISERTAESVFSSFFVFRAMLPSSYQWQETWRENQFLRFLALLEVPTDRKEQFYDHIVSSLSNVEQLPAKQKYYYLNYLSLLHPEVSLLTSWVNLYKKVQSAKVLTSEEVQIVADQYREMRVVDSLWPDLWKKIVEKAVRLSDEGEISSARVLFESVLLFRSFNDSLVANNKCDLLKNDDWVRIYDAFKEIPDFDIDGFFYHRIHLVFKSLRNLTSEVLEWAQRFFDKHPENDLFKSILLLHGKIELDSEEELTQAVQLIFEEFHDPHVLNEFCFEPCFQDQAMSRKQVILAS